MEAFHKIDSSLSTVKIKLETLQNIHNKQKEKKAYNQKMTNNQYFISSKEGQRSLSHLMLNRLIHHLEKLKIYGEEKTKLINEIVFEVRFGSLVKNNTTNQENTIDRAINIAIKLVKEGRWNTPTLLKTI